MSQKSVVAAWREVSRLEPLEQTLPRVLHAVGDATHLDGIEVYTLEPDGRRLRLIAAAGDLPATPPGRIDLGPPARTALPFFIERATCESHDRCRPLLNIFDPSGVRACAGPLVHGGRAAGVAVFRLTPRRGQRAPDIALLDGLLEPLATALGNDERLAELQRRSEAVAADNRALLSRLERTALDEDLVGASDGLREVMTRVEQVAQTDAPVLVLGETGSGKEVVARALHARSSRHDGPMLRVNCGAIAPELVDSELFGHERGSFTGAHDARRGWFERADGGTLFLDEIGELSPAAQVRLLRVLQDGTLERVGGSVTVTVDVRIVAATHRDLHEMVRARLFREDLWYRLSVFPIRLPPLRDRLGDIPALAAHFASRAGRRLGGVALVPGPSDIALLSRYSWPGNVRELGAVIERAAILGDGRSLEVAAALGMTSPGQPAASATVTVGAPLDAAIRTAIEGALRQSHGRIEGPRGAAARLGINAGTLRSRMRKLGLDWGAFRD